MNPVRVRTDFCACGGMVYQAQGESLAEGMHRHVVLPVHQAWRKRGGMFQPTFDVLVLRQAISA
jgi:hypothetical protein